MTHVTRIADVIKEIDAELGEGYARAHPELIGSLVIAEELWEVGHVIISFISKETGPDVTTR
jgi:hypothetical protein